jgi:hypothetical protein
MVPRDRIELPTRGFSIRREPQKRPGIPDFSRRDVPWVCRGGSAEGLRQADSAKNFRMDKMEALVERYLRHLGYTDIVHEPDGGIPPDFLIDRRIAVEVRRLDQTHDDGTGPRGLDEAGIPLWAALKRHLAQMGPAVGGTSWFIHVRYSRPIPKLKTLRRELDQALKPFMSNPVGDHLTRLLPSGIELTGWRTPNGKDTFFSLGAGNDEERGGWILDEMDKNIQLCIAEKTAKIAPYRDRYPVWWLVLPDLIGRGLSAFDESMFHDQVKISHNFDRLVLLNPSNHERAFDVPSVK